MIEWLGKILGIENLESVSGVEMKFAAPWASENPVLVIFGVAAMVMIGVVFYFRYQYVSRKGERALMAGFRAAILTLILLVLAEPVIAMTIAEKPRPLVVLLFDGSDSMNKKDKLPIDQADRLNKALAGPNEKLDTSTLSRMELVRQAMERRGTEFESIAKDTRIRAYVIDRVGQVREVDAAKRDDEVGFNAAYLAKQLSADGKVTALGAALGDVKRRHRSHLLSGVVVFSDYDQNAGVDARVAAKQLGAPVISVGVGPLEVADVAVDLQIHPTLKKDQKATATIRLRQTGLKGRRVRVHLTSRRMGTRRGGGADVTARPLAPPALVLLNDSVVEHPVSFEPSAEGDFVIEAKVDALADETEPKNNRIEKNVSVTDDVLKLFFVEHEPTWEWRFVKEVFHRDPLIGQKGFRTFLRSADFNVRRTNDLFLETLVRPRAEFFGYDVILLSDVPAEMLTDRFQTSLMEYVEKFGGGLVVIAGQNHGIGELARTKIGDMLPVVVEQSAEPRDSEFRLQLTTAAKDSDFMRLGKDELEHNKAWSNLGELQWYQPVMRPHPLATVLAEHPYERCLDNKTLQPIVATRRYGKGEVIYVGFNEMWRLRRKYGERYYRQFWAQLIYRLGLRRNLGDQKRFQVATDRRSYQAGEKVRVAVEGYNENYQPMRTDKLEARLIAPKGDGTTGKITTNVTIPMARDNVIFETTFPVFADGEHRLMVRDPLTGDEREINFMVTPTTVEQRSVSRNLTLQTDLANQTGGRHLELDELDQIAGALRFPKNAETTDKRFALWNTWAVLILILILMLGEWLVRKTMNLR